MQGRVTLRDVAAECGVHVSTVSRVLRGDRSRISTATVERVERTAAELGFTVDRWAASLRSGRTGTVGMLVPRITDVVLATVFESLEAAAAASGYQALVASTWEDPERRAAAIKRFREQRVDAIVVADARADDPELEALRQQGVPLLLVSRRSGTLPWVTGDDRGGGELAGRHAAATGALSVAVVAGPDFASTAVDRTAGFLSALAEDGIDREVVVQPSGFDLDSGRRAMTEILVRTTPEAVFVVNDFGAIGAMSALVAHGLRPGVDVSVVGYNDIAMAAALPVPLTSVRSDLHAMGQEAFARLRELIDGQEVEDLTIPTTLVVRESSSLTRSHTEAAS